MGIACQHVDLNDFLLLFRGKWFSQHGSGRTRSTNNEGAAIPCFDLGLLNQKECAKLISLGKDVWASATPMDWAKTSSPEAPVLALDRWLLSASAVKGLKIEQIYKDLHNICRSRIKVAKDKDKTVRKGKSDNVANVAQGIADNLIGFLSARRFPEDFSPAGCETFQMHIPRGVLRQIVTSPFIDQAEIQYLGEGGKILFKGTLPLAVVEASVRAVLAGREDFDVPAQSKDAQTSTADFLSWFKQLRDRLDKAIGESAVGTGYEEMVRAEVYRKLKIYPALGDEVLPTEINCWW